MSKKQQWFERGKKYIYPQMSDTWKNCVDIRCSDIYGGAELEVALNVMEALENGKSPIEAYSIIEKEQMTGGPKAMVVAVVFDFSKRGPEFYYYVSKNSLFMDNKKSVQEMIYNKQQQNIAFQKELDQEKEKTEDKSSEFSDYVAPTKREIVDDEDELILSK